MCAQSALDDANNDYHPIYATSIDSQDESASDDDDLVPTNDDMEENSCCDSHVESPSDVNKGNVVGDTPPYISHLLFPSGEPSSPGENNNGFTFLPSKSFPRNVEDLCLLELAKLICEIGAPLSAFSKIGKWRVTLSGLWTFLCFFTVKKIGTGLSQVPNGNHYCSLRWSLYFPFV